MSMGNNLWRLPTSASLTYMADEEAIGIIGLPVLESTASSEIEGIIVPEMAGGDGIYRPIIIADSSIELELTLDDAERLCAFLQEALGFMEGRKNGLM